MQFPHIGTSESQLTYLLLALRIQPIIRANHNSPVSTAEEVQSMQLLLLCLIPCAQRRCTSLYPPCLSPRVSHLAPPQSTTFSSFHQVRVVAAKGLLFHPSHDLAFSLVESGRGVCYPVRHGYVRSRPKRCSSRSGVTPREQPKSCPLKAWFDSDRSLVVPVKLVHTLVTT